MLYLFTLTVVLTAVTLLIVRVLTSNLTAGAQSVPRPKVPATGLTS